MRVFEVTLLIIHFLTPMLSPISLKRMNTNARAMCKCVYTPPLLLNIPFESRLGQPGTSNEH